MSCRRTINNYLLAGHEAGARLPTNINTITQGTAAPTSGTTPSSSAALSLVAALSTMSKPVTEIALGRGIPSLLKRMVERMLAWEYIDLAELPPARANVSKEALNATPNVLLIQSFESARNHRRLIPDITTWVQCFSIYTSVLATKYSEYVPELMAYMRDIIRVSKQFKWPAWIVYDTNYRQHMAETGRKDWSKVDPSIYSRCLTGWAWPTSWCEWCVSLDYNSNECPFGSARGKDRCIQPYPSTSRSSATARAGQTPTCIKYNKYGGDCKFGQGCKYRHVCSICEELHPKTKCTKGSVGEKPPQQ